MEKFLQGNNCKVKVLDHNILYYVIALAERSIQPTKTMSKPERKLRKRNSICQLRIKCLQNMFKFVITTFWKDAYDASPIAVYILFALVRCNLTNSLT